MNNIDMYCITDKKINFLSKLPFYLGLEMINLMKSILKCNTENNIYYKEKFYSELTFQYWYWKNQLKLNKNEWIGFVNKDVFWLNPTTNIETINEKNYSDNLLVNIDKKYQHYMKVLYANQLKFLELKK